MTKILTEFSKEKCATSHLENWLGYWRFFSQSSLLTLNESDGLFLIDAGLTKDQALMVPQGIFKADLKPEDVDQKIDYVVEYFNSRNMSFWWSVCPSSKPDNLGEYLKAHSFNEMDDTPIMAAELHNLVDDRPKPKDFVIKEANDEDSIRLFWDLWYTGYPMPEISGKLFADCFVEIGYHSDNKMKLFIGYLTGEPVATSIMILEGGVVGLNGVVVLPEARGKGIGTEMSLHPLRVARSVGYKIGVLDATQHGLGIYQRIGFHEVCSANVYTYASPDNVELEKKMKDMLHSPRNTTNR